MPLDLDQVVPYLLRRGLVTSRSVVDGAIRVEDVSRLNRVYLVSASPSTGYVVKAGPRAHREATILRTLHARDGVAGALRTRLPRLVAFDPVEDVLILHARAGGRPMARQDARSRTLARESGLALAALHRLPTDVVADLRGRQDPSALLRVHEVDRARLQVLSVAGQQVARLVQELDGLPAELDALATAAQEPEATIHGDIRWDNCLGVPGAKGRRTRVELIDWELATVGDPAVDVGAFLGEYLRVWLPSFSQATPAAAQRSRVELARLWPAIDAFWNAYAAPSGVGLGKLLRRAVRFAGARLIVAAAEEAQVGDWSPSLEDAVRVGAHVMRRPDEAGVQLLGLRPRWAR